MPILFAYDGSTGADWLSHYAVRMAARHPSKKLRLLYVRGQYGAEADLTAKVERIQKEGERASVHCELTVLALRGTVARTLLDAIPGGAESFLICGIGVGSGQRRLLAGTVADRLLRSQHCHVLALRVLQPGLLGLPRRLLLPVSGHPRGLHSALPFLKLFQADVSHLHILFVKRVGRWQFRMLLHDSAERLRRPGEAYCEHFEQEISEQLGMAPTAVDGNVVVSDDVAKEILIAANKTKSRLIYMGASERSVAERFLSGDPIEQVLRDATCDVAIYRGIE